MFLNKRVQIVRAARVIVMTNSPLFHNNICLNPTKHSTSIFVGNKMHHDKQGNVPY